MQLLQSDVKFGPHVPLKPGGRPVQTYLVVFVDDATRYIVGARFYPDQSVRSLEDCFRRAVQAYGAPDACFVDNGGQYRSRWFADACAKIGTRLLRARPYHPESKGKVERLNREIDKLLAEIALARPRTIDECNELLAAWVDEYYHRNPHSALGGVSPFARFRSDGRPLRFVAAEALKDAFLHTETRKVDKTGCVSFGGGLYEVGLAYAGRRVAIRFDPAWTGEIEMLREGAEPVRARKLAVSGHCGARRGIPEEMGRTPPETSRMLDALKAKRAEGGGGGRIATSFKDLWEGNGDV
jgi:hypothetical protein